MSKRAQVLAGRLEQGAHALAGLAEGLSDAEWKTVIPKDGRTVGVVIHHVASVYPVEVDVARAIGGGNAVTEVTWDLIAHMNAQHSHDHTGTGKKETIELLRKNSKAAADAVRNFTDEQLDSSAPFSLSAGAPMTAQFVIEDHAMRHSYHHLAKIKSALGRK
jgi:hypothetical protein